MGYRTQGLIHAHLLHLRTRLTAESGQGTVEYVALLFLVGAVFAAVVAAGKGNAMGIPDKIEKSLTDTLDALKPEK